MFHKVFVSLFFVLLSGCGTSDSTLKESGYDEAYIQGFHDGRHSGMQEAGNDFEHYIKDETRYQTDSDYRQGWDAGEVEGNKLQKQATAIGQGMIDNSYEERDVFDPDKVAKDAIKGVDTSELKSLE
ncbi:hypothetical protein [Vibrio alginolyticus]|uniref:hypothetical protein n=1 Tax=Vibrio alginolyticus TaxID=663 RepID=UPI001BD3292B|nr:hypothetical protein [Vibrio alginolyticus]MBS9816889.1 hypothetical protein [Vibrio alginolyticus]